MKTCPICGSTIFDDMDTCFGCMHRFQDDRAVQGDPAELSAGSEMRSRDAAAARAPASEEALQPVRGEPADLFGEFLVEFERFLGGFLVDRKVKIE